MKQSSATIMLAGKGEIRSIGSECDASCAMWSCCKNSVPDGSCRGFLLLNGKSQNLLNKTLNEDDKIYIQNVTRMVQGDCPEETREMLTQEVLRCLPETEGQPRETGLWAMVNAALGTRSTEHPEPEVEIRATSGFLAMLSASTKSKKVDNRPPVERQSESFSAIQRQLSPIDFEYQLPEICNDTCFIRRHCGAYPLQVGRLCVKRSEQYKNKERILK